MTDQGNGQNRPARRWIDSHSSGQPSDNTRSQASNGSVDLVDLTDADNRPRFDRMRNETPSQPTVESFRIPIRPQRDVTIDRVVQLSSSRAESSRGRNHTRSPNDHHSREHRSRVSSRARGSNPGHRPTDRRSIPVEHTYLNPRSQPEIEIVEDWVTDTGIPPSVPPIEQHVASANNDDLDFNQAIENSMQEYRATNDIRDVYAEYQQITSNTFKKEEVFTEYSNFQRNGYSKSNFIYNDHNCSLDDNWPLPMQSYLCNICHEMPFDVKWCKTCNLYWCGPCSVKERSCGSYCLSKPKFVRLDAGGNRVNDGFEPHDFSNLERAALSFLEDSIKIVCEFCAELECPPLRWTEAIQHFKDGCELAKCKCGYVAPDKESAHLNNEDCLNSLRDFAYFMAANAKFMKCHSESRFWDMNRRITDLTAAFKNMEKKWKRAADQGHKVRCGIREERNEFLEERRSFRVERNRLNDEIIDLQFKLREKTASTAGMPRVEGNSRSAPLAAVTSTRSAPTSTVTSAKTTPTSTVTSARAVPTSTVTRPDQTQGELPSSYQALKTPSYQNIKTQQSGIIVNPTYQQSDTLLRPVTSINYNNDIRILENSNRQLSWRNLRDIAAIECTGSCDSVDDYAILDVRMSLRFDDEVIGTHLRNVHTFNLVRKDFIDSSYAYRMTISNKMQLNSPMEIEIKRLKEEELERKEKERKEREAAEMLRIQNSYFQNSNFTGGAVGRGAPSSRSRRRQQFRGQQNPYFKAHGNQPRK